MIKQLTKVGNSQALILDKALLELVGLEDNGEVQLTVASGSIVITPASPRRADDKRFKACLDRVVKERRAVLRRLAR